MSYDHSFKDLKAPLLHCPVLRATGQIDRYSREGVKEMLGFPIDNIFVVFGNQILQQTVGIPMGTNCAPLLADLFLYSNEAEFIQNVLHEKN
jgi:hypothetical protein